MGVSNERPLEYMYLVTRACRIVEGPSEVHRWTIGREINPLELELTYPEPVDIRPYRDAFRCKLLFNAPRNSFKYSRADLTLPLPTSSPRMAEMHERFAGEYLAGIRIFSRLL